MPSTPPPSDDPSSRYERRGSLLSVLAGLVWPLQAAVIAYVVGRLLEDPASVDALAAGLAYVALAGIKSALEAMADRNLAHAAFLRISGLRAELIHTEAHAGRYSASHGPGALAVLAGEKLEALRPCILRFRPARFRSTIIPALILVLSLWHSWVVALALLVSGPLIPLFMALVGWAAKSASSRQMVEIGRLNDLLVDRLAALSDLRLIGAGARVVDGFGAASEDLRARTMSVLRIAFLSSSVLELFASLGIAMVAIWVGFTLLGEIGWGSWGATLSPEAGIYLLLLAPEFYQPLRDLAAAWHDKAASDAILQEIGDWRAEDRPQLPGSGCSICADGPTPSIRLQDLSINRGGTHIRYPDLDVVAGESVALIGPSGSGKSTLLRVLAGLERPDDGQVLIDGKPLSDSNVDAWRARIGWMPQTPHFLGRSVRYNIGFGRELSPGIVSAAHLSSVLEHLPRGDLTLLGERGAGLSGGEARRVALARALQRNPQVILADEPTADLDQATAAVITEALVSYARSGGTVVVATHDAALASRMDKSVRMPRGEHAHE